MSKSSSDNSSNSLSLAGVGHEGPWDDAQLASFIMRPGVGRVLCVGGNVAREVESQLVEAQYQVGYLDQSIEGEELIAAAATFMPDVIYLALEEDLQHGLDALESLSSDARTDGVPLLALLSEDADASVIQEAYSRTGCDFFRLGHTRVELLARTHLLVRLSKTHEVATGPRAASEPVPDQHLKASAANDPAGGRVDLRDDETELFSVGYFFHRLPTEVSRARRYRRALSLIAIRCPDAKRNETTATRLAAILRKHLRDSDISARLEGDLFVCLLPEVTSDSLDSLESRLMRDFQRSRLHLAIGRSGLDGQGRGCSPQDLVERARTLADQKLGRR